MIYGNFCIYNIISLPLGDPSQNHVVSKTVLFSQTPYTNIRYNDKIRHNDILNGIIP